MRPSVTLSESVLDALTSMAETDTRFSVNIGDPVFHLDNGVLGGTMTYSWYFDKALAFLKYLLSENGIDASGLIYYFSIEEVPEDT